MNLINNTDRLEFAVKRFEILMASEGKKLDKFKKSLEQDAVYAFSWSGEAVKASVFCRIIPFVIAMIKDDFEDGIANALKYYREEVIRLARYTPASTSVMSNLVENYQREVSVEILQILESL